MTPAEAKEVIDLLARGIAPTTGEILPEDGPLSDVRVVRALLLASDALAAMDENGVAARSRPAQAGTSWSDDEDERLARAYDSGTPVNELARLHERTRGAIRSRLKKLGKLEDDA
ncbi:hypothetical protein KEX41_29475 (plasmid) [Burkholderia thailandensis]|jgi:hypothetical protein|uniref:hypothetical protein n=1 Tax=Burkholderia thailandensis TaxID=57975 RepID=UPI00192DDEF3|nr:hypothetical protein [Burkholderia thailandensis]MBS2132314.1 hypothetical protein [Burkholderia thailandensis]QRA15123.1 hypothetical protein JMY07_29900 [Burkholderia thailandensis]